MLKTTPDNMFEPSPSEIAWSEKNIPFLGGRPDRDTTINVDDIMNLLIACNTCSTFEELFQLT